MTASDVADGAERVGVLGGTFDPPHLGHLAVAQDILEALSLDRVILVPAARPPHKGEEGLTPAPLRARMVRAAVEDDPRFEVSDLELRREGPSYMVDTLEALRDHYPDTRFYLILGADQWAAFATWNKPRRIAQLARIVVMTRNGESPAGIDPGFTDGPPPEIIEVPVTRLDVSSTQLRERLAGGRSIRYLVPAEVHRIIEAGKLYS